MTTNKININKQNVDKLFAVGDIVKSGGGRKYFRITEIMNDRVRIKPTEASTPSRLHYEKISAVINNLEIIDKKRIDTSIYDLLIRCGLKDTQNESYLYGFAKEFLARSDVDLRMTEKGRVKNNAIKRMANTAQNTVNGSNGQQVLRTTKNKELRFLSLENLENYIEGLIEAQNGQCAITGLNLLFDDQVDDQELLCSLDRIDSDGHYEVGNLQIVCRFVNRWKNDENDSNFRRLIALVRNPI